MVPKKIINHNKILTNKNDGETTTTLTMITCCSVSDFEVYSSKKTKLKLFQGMSLMSTDEPVAVDLICKRCGRIIHLFNSICDGYDNIEQNSKVKEIVCSWPAFCIKCKKNKYTVFAQYEYPSEKELSELHIVEKENAYTWFRVKLQCNECGKKHSGFLDVETG